MARELLVRSATLHCGHHGAVKHEARHTWIRIEGEPMLVRPDLESVTISACPNTIPGTSVRCSATLPVQARSESQWVTIQGDPVALSSTWGFTVCMPALASRWTVTTTGQHLVREDP